MRSPIFIGLSPVLIVSGNGLVIFNTTPFIFARVGSDSWVDELKAFLIRLHPKGEVLETFHSRSRVIDRLHVGNRWPHIWFWGTVRKAWWSSKLRVSSITRLYVDLYVPNFILVSERFNSNIESRVTCLEPKISLGDKKLAGRARIISFARLLHSKDKLV